MMDASFTQPNYIEKNSKLFITVTFALFLGGFATFALLYCVQPIMPIFSNVFAISPSKSSLVLSISTSTLAIGLLITGPISDALGRKPIMIIALLSAATFTFISAIVPNWQLLLICRALLGLSLSGLAAVAMAYLNEEIAPQHLGVAMGLYIAGNALGGMGGRLISGILTDFLSWRAVLAIMGIIALTAAFLFWKFLPPSKHFEPTPLKITKLFNGYIHHLTNPKLPLLFLEGFLLMGSFVTLFNYIAYRLLEAPYFLNQAWIGVLSIVYLAGIFSSAQFGALADKYTHARMLWVGITIMLTGAVITLINSLFTIFIGMIIFTFGFFGAHSIACSWVSKSATKAKGLASSLYLFGYYMGSSLIGTSGGYFWQLNKWNGVISYISCLMALSLMIAFYLKHKSSQNKK